MSAILYFVRAGASLIFLTIRYLFFTTDSARVASYSPTTTKSWIGRTVTLKCVSDGVPTPTVTWLKPDGGVLIAVTAKENTVDVNMAGDGDFGDYKCVTDNGIKPTDTATVTLLQISKLCFFRNIINFEQLI